jgi:hypothetical protein
MPRLAGGQPERSNVLHLVKVLTETDIDDIIGDLKAERLTDSTRGLWEDQIQEWGDAELGRVGSLGVSFDIRNPLVTDHLSQFEGVNIVGANTTTQSAIRVALAEGIAAGEGVRDLKRRVSGVFGDASGFRTERIARTEVLRSSNFASFQAHRVSGVVESRQWFAAFINTRDAHAELHLDKKPLDQPFVAFTDKGNRATAMYPGGFGVAELDINCMCTTIPITISGRSADYTDKHVGSKNRSAMYSIQSTGATHPTGAPHRWPSLVTSTITPGAPALSGGSDAIRSLPDLSAGPG